MKNEESKSVSHLVIIIWLLMVICIALAAICLRFLTQNQITAAKTYSTDRNASSDFIHQSTTTHEEQVPLVSKTLRISSEELSTISLFKAASPSVVHITTESVRRSFLNLDLMKIPKGSGTGFIWDKEGHVVTNFHVIQDADLAHIALHDHSTWPAALVGIAPDKDLAVLKIDVPQDQLIPVIVGQSKDLEVGLKVFAIGNPFGLDQTLTTGIISALGREIESVTRRPIRDVVQTDAAINPGNSGGPLLGSDGLLIGVNTAIYSPSGAYAGIGFAIPADTVRRVVPQLIEHGRLIRPGLKIELAPDSLAARFNLKGAIILNIDSGSTAEAGGLTPTKRSRTGEIFIGDIITAVNDKPILSSADLWAEFEDYNIGATVRLKVLREGKPRTLEVKLEAVE